MNFKCYKYKENWHIIIKMQKQRSRKSKKKNIKTKQQTYYIQRNNNNKTGDSFLNGNNENKRTKIEGTNTFRKSF